MRKAFDTFLLSEVSAEMAAKSGGLDPYRYECAHCGEDVRLAAVSSVSMVPHFRHRSGNNDVECENYLGQCGAISTDSRSRICKNERAEFYFDNRIKLFYLGLRLSDGEIAFNEQQKTTFELRAFAQEQAFFTLSINKRNFASDIPTMIPIQKFSYNYFLSNTINSVKRKYEVFKNCCSNAATFFKIQGNDSDYKAKQVRSSILYTNVPYLVVFQSQYSSPWDRSLPSDIKVDDTFRFETMGRKFLGKSLTIKAKTAFVDSLLMSWGYQLEASETLTLLWPPASLVDEVSLIRSNNAYLYSSFELEAYGNINVHSNDICRIANGISRVSVNARIKVYRKNAEIVIDEETRHSVSFDQIKIEEIPETAYTISDDSTHFLFNSSGVGPLTKGQSVFLTPDSVIRRYLFGYMNGCIYLPRRTEFTGERLLKDVLAYYKRTESFTWDDFDSIELSKTAFRYIESCEESGLINSAVKHFIEERRI